MPARIGIEISTTAVRIAVVSGESHPSLTSYASVDLPEGAIREGSIVSVEAVRSAVGDCVAQLKLPRQSFAKPTARVAVTGLRAIAREIEMPYVPDNELDAAVRLQSLDVLPFPVSEALLSARRLTKGQEAGPVLVAAAHRDLVQPLIDAVEQSGIVVSGVDLSASALIRTLGTATGSEAGAEAIISIGAHLTTLVVHERGELVFLRTITGGGAAVTGAIARALDVPFQDAERLKYGLPSAPDGLERVQPRVLTAIREGATELLGELRSSLDYFASTHPHPELTRVLVTGGGALLPGLVDRLRLAMRVPVEVPGRFAGLTVETPGNVKEPFAQTAAVAIGMALPDSQGRKSINLLPEGARTEQRLQRATHRIFLGAAAVGVVLLGLGGLRFVQVHSAEHAVASINDSIATLRSTIPKYSATERTHDRVIRDEDLVSPIISAEVNWPAVISALKEATPSSVDTSGFSGTVSSTPASTTAVATGSVAGEESAKAAVQIGTIDLEFSGNGYPSFRQWFDAITSSKAFQIVEYSGVTSTSSTVQFTAELGITSTIHSSRLSSFEETKS